MDTAAKLPRILLVDDHPDTVAIMSLVLTRRGYSVVRAYSVTAARAAAETHQCDLLITDGNLPDGNGIELMRELKAKHAMPACSSAARWKTASRLNLKGSNTFESRWILLACWMQFNRWSYTLRMCHPRMERWSPHKRFGKRTLLGCK